MSVEKSLEAFKKAIDGASKTHNLAKPDGDIFAGKKMGYALRKPTVSPTASTSTSTKSTSSSSAGDDDGFEVLSLSTPTLPEKNTRDDASIEKNTIDDATVVKAFHNIWANFNSALSAGGISSLTVGTIFFSGPTAQEYRQQLFSDLNNAFSTLFNPSYPESNATFYGLSESFQKVITSFIGALKKYEDYLPERYRGPARNFLNSLQFIFQSIINTKTINEWTTKLDTELKNTQLSTQDKLKLIEETQNKILILLSENQSPNSEFSLLYKFGTFFENVSKQTELMFEGNNKKQTDVIKSLQAKVEDLQEPKSTPIIEEEIASSSTSTTPSPEASDEEANIDSEIPVPPTSSTEAVTSVSAEISDIPSVDKNFEEPVKIETEENVQTKNAEELEKTETQEKSETKEKDEIPASLQKEESVEIVKDALKTETSENVQRTNIEESEKTEAQKESEIKEKAGIPENVQTEKSVKEPAKPETSLFSFGNFSNFFENLTQSEQKASTPQTQPEKSKSEDTFSFNDILNRLSSEADALGKKIADTASSILESEKDQKKELERKKVRNEFHENITIEDKEDKPFSAINEGENSNQITDDLVPITENKSSQKVTPNIRVRDPYAYHILPSDDVVLYIEAAKPAKNPTIETVTADEEIKVEKVDVEATTKFTETDTIETPEKESDTSIFKILAFVSLIVALTVIGATLGLAVGGIPGAIAGGLVGAFAANAIMAPVLFIAESVDEESMEEDQEENRLSHTTDDGLTEDFTQKKQSTPVTHQVSVQPVITQTSTGTGNSEGGETIKTQPPI